MQNFHDLAQNHESLCVFHEVNCTFSSVNWYKCTKYHVILSTTVPISFRLRFGILSISFCSFMNFVYHLFIFWLFAHFILMKFLCCIYHRELISLFFSHFFHEYDILGALDRTAQTDGNAVPERILRSEHSAESNFNSNQFAQFFPSPFGISVNSVHFMTLNQRVLPIHALPEPFLHPLLWLIFRQIHPNF